uniref:Uncharacterized protein n=1 Tax=Lactuca sativa TaxID=4236 RepID=A0A9R1VGK7_LACSA|nr:hypothetical protein LSAT_V11C500288900 [Lactuca sativa]
MLLLIFSLSRYIHRDLRGNVVALHGKETNSGDFLVEDILEAGLPPQLDLPNKSGEDKYVVLVSGLNVGSSSSNPLQLQLLVDHITGHLGDKKEQQSAAEIVQVVVAGNSVKIDHSLLNGQIAAGIPIDIIPGYNDPTNFALPQQGVTPLLIGTHSSLRAALMFTLLVNLKNLECHTSKIDMYCYYGYCFVSLESKLQVG